MKKDEIKITLTEPQQRAIWHCIDKRLDALGGFGTAMNKEEVGMVKSLEAVQRKIVEARNAKG
jgi:hypothetical protein